ncbi:MAG TPA: hypothetical protein PLX89_02350 [Verrucomicrobiota bacterium]|nr:hypothetical protein [Verrucomicrobiales bacterium]HRI11819.1 hypothetical protein [Verrucomicrobiota bacterium]
MLHDDLIHGAYATSAPGDRNRSLGRIECETPLLPEVIAEGVWGEACELLRSRLPVSWIQRLADRAETLYVRNARFRRRLQEPGNRGRDWLWAFTRHWLAALIHEHRPHLSNQLPSCFSNGVAISRKYLNSDRPEARGKVASRTRHYSRTPVA